MSILKSITKVIITLISLPIVVAIMIITLPFKFLKLRERDKASKLFSSYEKQLLYKSQKAINMDRTAIIKPDKDIVSIANLIEESRIEYQMLDTATQKELEFTDFISPRLEILKIKISDWESANKYFNIIEK